MSTKSISTQELERHCVMRCDPSWFALRAVSVREVCPVPNIAKVPGSDASLVGLCHHRNEFIPVLSLDRLLASGREPRKGGEQMVVISTSNVAWALLVDAVTALEPLQVSINADGRMDDVWSSSVIGSATNGDRVVLVLDATALYRLAERILGKAWDEKTNHK